MRFIFFYPSRTLGGAELLLARVATHMARKGIAVAIVDLPGGKLSELAEAEGLEVIHAESGSPAALAGANTIIAPASHMVDLRHWIRGDESTRQLFWMIHPYGAYLVPPLLQSFFYAHLPILYLVNRLFLNKEFLECRSALGWLMQHKGLVFMDFESYRQTSRWYRLPEALEPVYLPIPMGVDFPEEPPHRAVSTTMNLFWVGRLVDFKIHPLKYFAQRLAQADQARAIKLHIVGSGDQFQNIAEFMSKLDIHFSMLGELDSSSLHSILLDQADLLVAMGTSALEGARLGIPTVSIDASYKPMPGNYKFTWIFERPAGDLGRIIDAPGEGSPGFHDIDELLFDLRRDGKSLSKKCWMYFMNHHDISIIANKLIEISSTTSISIEFSKVFSFKPGFFSRIYKQIFRRNGHPH